MRPSLVRVLASGILFALAGCAASLYIPTAEDAVPGTAREELLQGRELYVQKCGSCHGLRLPESYTGPEWQNHLRVMAPRAHLSDQDENLIWKFLLAGTERTKRK
jgi:hypothetical protein